MTDRPCDALHPASRSGRYTSGQSGLPWSRVESTHPLRHLSQSAARAGRAAPPASLALFQPLTSRQSGLSGQFSSREFRQSRRPRSSCFRSKHAITSRQNTHAPTPTGYIRTHRKVGRQHQTEVVARIDRLVDVESLLSRNRVSGTEKKL